MRKKTALIGLVGLVVLLALSAGILTAFTGKDTDELMVEVTITNLTRGQTMTSVFFARHDGSAAPLYTLGQPASDGLASMAEDGSASGLLEAWDSEENSSVAEARTAGGLIRPGQSVTITFTCRRRQAASLLSQYAGVNE